MRVSLDDLVQRVKTNMEELTDEGSVTVKSGINIETYIQNKMADAVLAVWVSTPLSELPQNDCASALEPERRSDGSGRVTLPEDVWRMTEFCMEGWRQPVTTFIDRTSPLYELQFNPYTRGGSVNPVCVLSDEEGVKYLDYYSLPLRVEEHQVKTARYVPYPRLRYNGYEMSDALVPVVCSTCAALVFEILGQPDRAASMLRGVVR